MTWYLLPAALAMMIKLWLLFTLKLRAGVGVRWMGFVAIFCVQNLSELLLLSAGFNHQASTGFFMRCYYACVCIVIVYCYIYVMNEKDYIWQKLICWFVCLVCVLFVLGIFFSDLIITGYTYLPYSVTATKGDLYFLFRIFALLFFLMLFTTIINNYVNAKAIEQKVHYFYTLLAFLPLTIICSAVVFLMAMDFNINAIMLLPVASTLFLIISLKGESSTTLPFDWRSWLPLSLEHRLRGKLRAAEQKYINKSSSHQETMMQIEKALLEYQRDKHGGSIAKASKTIGIMRSTFYSKMNRFDKT